MVLRRRAEIPKYWFIILRQQCETANLILRPGTDVRGRDVAHVVHVEAQQRTHFGLGQQVFHTREAFAAQPVKIDPLLPIDGHGSVSFESHKFPPYLTRTSPALLRTPF